MKTSKKIIFISAVPFLFFFFPAILSSHGVEDRFPRLIVLKIHEECYQLGVPFLIST